jgi:PKHD-type hydroxylase
VLDPAVAARVASRLVTLPSSEWEDGRDSAGPQARQVKANLQLAPDHVLAQDIRQLVLQALDRSPDFLSRALPAKIFPPRINRYDPQHPAYGWHIDNAIRVRSDGQHVRTDLSCTVVLSDPQDYDGGELAVREGDVEHVVKLRAGDAILYPSGLLHEVRPVTRGMRLACFFWVQSLVPGDHERRVLHELDRNLTALRNRVGECHETVALLGVYHNLLRLWSR